MQRRLAKPKGDETVDKKKLSRAVDILDKLDRLGDKTQREGLRKEFFELCEDGHFDNVDAIAVKLRTSRAMAVKYLRVHSKLEAIECKLIMGEE